MTTNIYTLNDINNILFNGFNYQLEQSIVDIISKLALEVGSPDYVKTPIFHKKERDSSCNSTNYNRKKKNKPCEINDETWHTIRNFQSTKIEHKEGIDGIIEILRSHLNKITDKNYATIKIEIFQLIQNIIEYNNSDDIQQASSSIFELASTNRFYSKIYADLYTELIKKYPIFKAIFDTSLSTFLELFKNIEYVDSNENYDKFCKINKDNEKRKACSTFFINLMLNGIISKSKIIEIFRDLLNQVTLYVQQENKKNEVDEIIENLAILFNREVFDEDEVYEDKYKYELINGNKISEHIRLFANSKSKDYKSLSNKSIFKFMDMIEI
jgi:hypothetical protein